MATIRRHPRSVLGFWGSSVSQRSFVPSWTAHSNGLSPLNLRFQSSSSENSFSHPDEPNQHTTRHRRRSKSQPESRRLPLGVDSLGKPGEIVVVPPKRTRTSNRKPRETKDTTGEDARTVTLGSMLEDLEEEAAIPTPSLIRERIESYRSSWGPMGKLADSDWEAVRSSLASSFTYTQLSEYIEAYVPHESQPEGSTGRWRPGTSAFVHANSVGQTGVANRVPTSQDLKGKPLLAERILRDCWQLSIADEIGQLDLRLPPAFIALLLNAEHFSFDEVAGLHQSSIDITSSLGLVRITGRQGACESIREIILDATARIREDAVDIRAPTPTPDSVPERILYLAENKHGADNARRTLNLALHGSTPASVPFSTYFPASEPANVYKYNPGANVSWPDQQKEWFRWAMPSTQAVEMKSNPTPFFDGHQTRLSDHLLSLLRKAPAPNSGLKGGLTVHESVTAAVGCCLFARKSSLEDAPISASQLGKSFLQRTFATEIPQITRFLGSLQPITPEDETQVHHIRLTPSFAYSGVVPKLDVKIASRSRDSTRSSENPFDVRSIKLVLESNAVDYLLPENGLDLRFTRTAYCELSEAAIAESPAYQGLAESIRSSLRDAFDSRRTSSDSISLPAFCQISLPADLLQSAAHSDSATSLTAEYILPPLNDIRDAALQQFNFAGRRLNYSFYESGPFLAARTTDVSLDMKISSTATSVNDDGSQISAESDFHSFYNAACRVAFQIHNLRHTDAEDGLFDTDGLY
ncbi:uncharacterized protein N7482_003227 [Penicillium canariense]|uniref:Uncharacterized protein n=1 Tax=Penicillium canariense TaxID=189055 RepID=A0A9W9LPE0_9EURO|nr:uncharacterized protein N7482_003227 [Penicillium canariense]KAJ5167633.1 hypothetical protein N7482_003227 [Penicillium canariense]